MFINTFKCSLIVEIIITRKEQIRSVCIGHRLENGFSNPLLCSYYCLLDSWSTSSVATTVSIYLSSLYDVRTSSHRTHPSSYKCGQNMSQKALRAKLRKQQPAKGVHCWIQGLWQNFYFYSTSLSRGQGSTLHQQVILLVSSQFRTESYLKSILM